MCLPYIIIITNSLFLYVYLVQMCKIITKYFCICSWQKIPAMAKFTDLAELVSKIDEPRSSTRMLYEPDNDSDING